MVEDGTTLNGVPKVDGAKQIKGRFRKQLWQLNVYTFFLCAITSFLPSLVMTKIVSIALMTTWW
jgi:hypothetical protein